MSWGYGGYNPSKSFWQNLTGTAGQVGSYFTPNVQAAPEPLYRPINPQGTPAYIPPDQSGLFSGAAKGYVAAPTSLIPPGGDNRSQTTNQATSPTNQPSPWTSAPQQVPGGPSDEDLASIYNPAFSSLAEQQRLLESQLPGAEQSIEAQYGLASKEMEANRLAQEAALGRQETNVSTAKANSLQQARQLYNELAQNYGARFGSRTSAGPFAMELLGRETQRQFGGIETGAMAATQAITDERNRVMDYINTQKEQFALKKNDALREIKTTFMNKLAEIGSARNALESEKASRRVQELQNARNMAMQIQSAENEFNQRLYMFQLEQDATLKNKAAAASGYDTKYLDATKKVGDILTSYGPQAAESAAKQAGVSFETFAPGKGYQWVWNPASGKYEPRQG